MKLPGMFALPRRLTKFLADYEKVILAILAVVIVISGTIWFRELFGTNSSQPTVGGTYVEGIIGDQSDVEAIATRLTKTGLFSFDKSGKLTNNLISSYQTNTEKTNFTLTLLDGVDSQDIANTLEDNLDLIGPANISRKGQQITINLPNSNPNLPLQLAEPLFDYGPFVSGKITDKGATFTRSTQERAVKPFLNKIIIRTYADQAALKDALDSGKLDGAENHGLVLPDSFHFEPINFQRYYAVLFNLNKSPFRDDKLRRALIDGSSAPNTPFTLTVPDQEPYKTLAQDAVNQWQSRGASVQISYQKPDDIQNKIGPSRDFEAILTGIDYGVEADPFYLWHSSQIRPPGNNLTGLKNDTVDQLIDQIRNSLDLSARTSLITKLHQTIAAQGAAIILREESSSFVVSNSVQVLPAWGAATDVDRYNSAALWSVK